MTKNQKWLLGLAITGAAVVALNARRARQTQEMLARYNAPGEKERRRSGAQPGDVLLFYRAGRKRDYFIQFFTDSPFYHAALYAGEEEVIEARPRGITRDNLQGRDRSFVVAPAPDGKGQAALDWARTQIGDPFSHLDLFVNGLDRIFIHFDLNYTTPDKFTCAEFVTRSFDHAGIDLFPGRDREDIAPSDLAILLPSEARPEAVVPSLARRS